MSIDYSKVGRQILVFSCYACLFIPLLMFCAGSFLSARSERKKLDTYVETDCLVKNSSLEKGDVKRSKQSDKQCYQLNWRIEYIQYLVDQQTTITQPGECLQTQTTVESTVQPQLRKYQIDTIYSCYHSPANRLTEVQLEQPSVDRYQRSITGGTLSLLLWIGLTVVVIYGFSTIDLNCRNRLLQFYTASRALTLRGRDARVIPSMARASSTIPADDGHVVLTLPPPPAYIPSSTSVDEGETIPLIPPPTYVASSISVENENNPSTLPLPYARFAV